MLVCVLYLGDYVSVTYVSHDQLDKVQITKFYAVPQKDGKTSYEPAEPDPPSASPSWPRPSWPGPS